jgi:subtilisin family serine protease
MEVLESRLMMRAPAWGGYARFIMQDAAASSFPNVNGRGETIAVIDTGISTKSSALKGKVAGGWNFIDNTRSYNDTDGHGTAVAGVLAGRQFTFQGQRYRGIAPSARLLALKVVDGVNDPPASRIRGALQWCLDNGDRYNLVAINISEGMASFGSKTFGADYGDLLAQLAAKGVFIGAAAGNESNHSAVDYPGADVSVAAVGSTDLNDQVSSFSNSGAALDILAPGQNIVAPTIVNGKSRYAVLEGTSFATPIVVGAAALVRQVSPTFSTQQILQILQNTPFNDTDPFNGLTFPRVDLFNSIMVATQLAPSSRFARVFAK